MAFATRLLALCALVELCSGAARAEPLAPFLDRMRAANAGASGHRRSVSQVAVDGRSDTRTTDTEGLRFFTRQCNERICSGIYFDGRRLFSVNINDTALPQSHDVDRYLRGVRTITSLAFLAPSFARDGGRVVDEGVVTDGGSRYRELFVANLEATPMHVLVDPATAIIARVRDDDGKPVPYRAANHWATIAGPLGAPTGVGLSIIPGAPLMPLDSAEGSPVGPCIIAGVAARCMIDTGNSGLSMSLELAERLGLDPIGAYDIRGLGSLTAEVVRAGPLLIANARFEDANYVVLPNISRYGYDLILGADALAASTVEIDGPGRRLWFGASPPAGAATIPITFENFVPVVDVHLGDVLAPLAIDTGDESNINLANVFYRQHADLFTATEAQRVTGIGDTSVELVGKISQVDIGPFRLTAQRIGTTESLQGTASGHLGASFFRNFTVVLNYADGTVALLPHK
ncbi:MAG: retropepsin-like domain-containing protein [Candidatus Eremiobacteraeota bacterium]|nr:retropepsin-like domain-containing protein [Candidatus Eremiobacteraeota bacterium]